MYVQNSIDIPRMQSSMFYICYDILVTFKVIVLKFSGLNNARTKYNTEKYWTVYNYSGIYSPMKN